MRITFLLLTLVTLSGCAITPQFPNLNRPERPKTVYNWQEELVSTPQVLAGTDGKNYVSNKTEKRLSINLDTSTKKAGFFDRVGGFLGGLGFWMIVLLVLGLVFAPGITIPVILGKLFQYKNAFKQTVAAIKESKAVDENPKLHDALKAKQDDATKKLVGILKPAV